jgi:uncharacterized protein with von Willebrand factor type A (vWA) domain
MSKKLEDQEEIFRDNYAEPEHQKIGRNKNIKSTAPDVKYKKEKKNLQKTAKLGKIEYKKANINAKDYRELSLVLEFD